MDIHFLNEILDRDGATPEDYSVWELTLQLMEQLGSTDTYLRNASYGVLGHWIWSGPGVYYSPTQLITIGKQMAYNLTVGIGEQGTDSVFLRCVSVLALDKVIDVDNQQAYLDEAQIREWLEQGLAYLKNERDGRGWVPGKGWAHAIAHASDLFWVLTRSRYLGEADLERILNAIADKVIEPVDYAYVDHEDDRLVSAVMSGLLRDLLEMPFLITWLDRLAHPAGQIAWTEVQQLYHTEERLLYARQNTITFTRSLYFQLLLGNNPHPSFANNTPAVRDALLPYILDALKAMDRWVYAK